MTDKADPWRVPVAVAQIPDTGLHRDIEADRPCARPWRRSGACARFSSAKASLDVTPKGGGRFHVGGRVRARVGQTCVVTLDPIENDIDEEIDLIFAPPEQIPEMADLVDEAAESDVEIPDPPEPIENGVIDLGRLATDALFLAIDPYPRRPRCGVRAAGRSRRSRRSSVCRAESAASSTPNRPARGSRKSAEAGAGARARSRIPTARGYRISPGNSA